MSFETVESWTLHLALGGIRPMDLSREPKNMQWERYCVIFALTNLFWSVLGPVAPNGVKDNLGLSLSLTL